MGSVKKSSKRGEDIKARGWVRPKNFGGKQPGAGRKAFAVELRARERILQLIGGDAGFDRLVKKIYKQAVEKGSFRHQELLLNYIIGKPADRVQLETLNPGAANVGAPIIKIIADTLRLERLNKDIEDKDLTTPEDRIKEAEEVLNTHINGKQHKEDD